jgi:pyruvate dehydrogenase E2 component (dihydrolipoamide acetyltransferase)
MPPAAAPSVRRQARELGVELSGIEGTGPGGRILSADVERASSERSRGEPAKRSNVAAVASPRAKRVAAELGIDWTRLSGTGAGGRIREQDVRAAAVQRTSPANERSERRHPLSSRRRVIARRMLASRQQTVPVTLTTRADATNLVELRERYKSMGGATLIPSYQDIIIKIVAEVLKRHRLLAARLDENAIVFPADEELHVGMAVDTDEGLLVPVLQNVGSTSLIQVAAQSRSLIERARAGTLAVADMQGAVFTITNLGAYGIDAFTPIINAPESAILGLGAIRREPVVLDDGQIVARSQLTLSLTFDHRIVDGAPAARFLQTLVAAIANSTPWLLGE